MHVRIIVAIRKIAAAGHVPWRKSGEPHVVEVGIVF